MEKIVKLDTAKLAKAKGFRMEAVTYAYNPDGTTFHREYIPHDYNIRGLLSAPSHDDLVTWLRIEHELHCSVIPTYQYEIQPSWFAQYHDLNLGITLTKKYIPKEDYYEALEDSLTEALDRLETLYEV